MLARHRGGPLSAGCARTFSLTSTQRPATAGRALRSWPAASGQHLFIDASSSCSLRFTSSTAPEVLLRTRLHSQRVAPCAVLGGHAWPGSCRFFATTSRPAGRKRTPGRHTKETASAPPRRSSTPSDPARSTQRSGAAPSATRQRSWRPATRDAAADAAKQKADREQQRKKGTDESEKTTLKNKVVDAQSLKKKEEDRRRLPGLIPELQQAFDDMKFPAGFTDIQYYGIPEVLKRKDTILASQTGTGKTLAYLLPLIQMLHADEEAGVKTVVERPPCLIILPNRELSQQVLSVVKQLSHYVKIRSAGITSGVKIKIQKESLASPVDIIVTTPGRFLQHFERERVYFSALRYLVIDEGDTLFDKTFKEDIEKMLTIVRKRVNRGDKPPQTIISTATLTSELSSAIDQHFPNATLVATSGLHRPIARLRHDFVHITTNDKHEPLLKVLLGSKTGGKTIVFCNDMQSARSTHHFLTEQGFNASCLHSGILPKRRAEYFEQFKSGESPILVCTDIASRGLDTISVDHVVLFDFPQTVTGYLHRVGRTARGGRRGRVTCILKKGERVFEEAIEQANKKQITLSEVLPLFETHNPQKKERLAKWLDPLALLPSHKGRGSSSSSNKDRK